MGTLQILYNFVLRAKVLTTFLLTTNGSKLFFQRVVQKYIKFANFALLYFPQFRTFRDQALEFY